MSGSNVSVSAWEHVNSLKMSANTAVTIGNSAASAFIDLNGDSANGLLNNAGSITVGANGNLSIDGAYDITNSGTITLQFGGEMEFWDSLLVMSGGGEIDMDGGEIGTPGSLIALENADQTIVGGGAIQVALANDATGVVDANSNQVSLTLVATGGGVDSNFGVMEATTDPSSSGSGGSSTSNANSIISRRCLRPEMAF